MRPFLSADPWLTSLTPTAWRTLKRKIILDVLLCVIVCVPMFVVHTEPYSYTAYTQSLSPPCPCARRGRAWRTDTFGSRPPQRSLGRLDFGTKNRFEVQFVHKYANPSVSNNISMYIMVRELVYCCCCPSSTSYTYHTHISIVCIWVHMYEYIYKHAFTRKTQTPRDLAHVFCLCGFFEESETAKLDETRFGRALRSVHLRQQIARCDTEKVTYLYAHFRHTMFVDDDE